MRLKYDFETMKLDEWIVAVPVGDSASEFQGVVKLGETANVIFELLRKETSYEQLVEELANQFDAPKDVLAADVKKLIDDFTEKGLLENENDN